MPADEHNLFYDRDSLCTEIYDAWAEHLIAGSRVEGDAEFYMEQARRWGGPVLDVGCGTGRIGIALAERGVDVVRLDLSAPMLRIAERKRAGLTAEVARRLSFVLGRHDRLLPRSDVSADRHAISVVTVHADAHGAARGARVDAPAPMS